MTPDQEKKLFQEYQDTVQVPRVLLKNIHHVLMNVQNEIRSPGDDASIPRLTRQIENLIYYAAFDSPSVIGPPSPLPTPDEFQRAVSERKSVDTVVAAAHAHWLEQIRIHDEEPDYRFKFRTAYGTLAKLGEALALHALAASPQITPPSEDEPE